MDRLRHAADDARDKVEATIHHGKQPMDQAPPQAGDLHAQAQNQWEAASPQGQDTMQRAHDTARGYADQAQSHFDATLDAGRQRFDDATGQSNDRDLRREQHDERRQEHEQHCEARMQTHPDKFGPGEGTPGTGGSA